MPKNYPKNDGSGRVARGGSGKAAGGGTYANKRGSQGAPGGGSYGWKKAPGGHSPGGGDYTWSQAKSGTEAKGDVGMGRSPQGGSLQPTPKTTSAQADAFGKHVNGGF